MENVDNIKFSKNSEVIPYKENRNEIEDASSPSLPSEVIEKMVNNFYKVNYLLKHKKIEYVKGDNRDLVKEEQVERINQEENLIEIIKEIDKEPIEYNQVYFINRDPLYYNKKEKEKKKIKKAALLQDLTVKPKNTNKDIDYSEYNQLNDLDVEYKKRNNK